MAYCSQSRNYVDEMVQIINEIIARKKEPEMCNIRCPPLGCPRGPCPGACSYQGVPDPCCMSQLPSCYSPPPPPPVCYGPPACLLKAYAKAVGYPPESCFSPPTSRLRLLLGYDIRRMVPVECPPCCINPPNCATSCCPSSPC